MRTPIGLAMAALMTFAAVQAFAPRQTAALAATRLPHDRLQFNTLVQTKAGLIAAGELGYVLYSINQGKEWQRAAVPMDRQTLINQITMAADGLNGIAVGHEGWIMRTSDGGLSWKEVAFDEHDGVPLMSVAHLPSGIWIAVGAFGRALQSTDDGTTWKTFSFESSAVQDKHLNRIVGSSDGQHWLVVGERGLVLRSDDGGNHWKEVTPFYTGSLYNAVALPTGGWLVYGMRGNAFVNSAEPTKWTTWTKSNIPAPISFFSHALQSDGSLLLAGQGNMLAVSKDGGLNFSLTHTNGRATLTDLQIGPNGEGWLASDAGLQRWPAQETPAQSLPTKTDGSTR